MNNTNQEKNKIITGRKCKVEESEEDKESKGEQIREEEEKKRKKGKDEDVKEKKRLIKRRKDDKINDMEKIEETSRERDERIE